MTISLEDRFEIQDLYARYCVTIDSVDGEGWADCFTEDGSFTPASGPARGETSTGRAELATFGNDLSRRYTHPSRHWNTNIVFHEEVGDSLRATCYGLLFDVSEPTPRPTASIVYYDELRRTPEGWRIHTRAAKRDGVD